MVKQTEKEAKKPEQKEMVLTVDQHNELILQDRIFTFIELSVTRSEQNGDPKHIIAAGKFLRDHCRVLTPRDMELLRMSQPPAEPAQPEKDEGTDKSPE